MPANEPASPTCLAHEADEAYMGFASPADIEQFRIEFDAASGLTKVKMLRQMLPKIRSDALHAEFSALLAEISIIESKT